MYDTVNINLLFHDLSEFGISTKFLCAVKSIYKQAECVVKVNGH